LYVQVLYVQVLYVQVLKAIYGMLQSALLFYKKLNKDLQSIGFKINPYDICVANKKVNGSNLTVTWHADDLKVSRKDKTAVDTFIQWCERTYGSKDIGHVKASRGKKHDYLGMNLDYTEEGAVKIEMCKYVQSMIDTFPVEIKIGSKTPASEGLFKVNDASPKLNDRRKEQFHTTVAKGLFVSKRARPDICTTIAFLCTLVMNPKEEDWTKLVKLMKFLYATKEDSLRIKFGRENILEWYVDAAYAVHPDMRSHTGFTLFNGEGGIQSTSLKQKINTRSSTEAELVTVKNSIGQII